MPLRYFQLGSNMNSQVNSSWQGYLSYEFLQSAFKAIQVSGYPYICGNALIVFYQVCVDSQSHTHAFSWMICPQPIINPIQLLLGILFFFPFHLSNIMNFSRDLGLHIMYPRYSNLRMVICALTENSGEIYSMIHLYAFLAIHGIPGLFSNINIETRQYFFYPASSVSNFCIYRMSQEKKITWRIPFL